MFVISDDLADFVTMAMAGMSAAARDGAGEATLKDFTEAMSRAFRHDLTLRSKPVRSGYIHTQRHSWA